jgi:hypothetical protein
VLPTDLGRDWIALDVIDTSFTSRRTWFNLTTGSVGTSQYGTPSIVPLPNGYNRCILENVVHAPAAGTGMRLYVVSADNSIASIRGDTSKGVIHALSFVRLGASF